jgi:hypothetical protein
LAVVAAACTERPAAAPAPAPPAPAPAAPSPAEACADRWLAAHNLNPYGDPPETSYTGGTPLFDERTGQRKDRLGHLFGKHEALKTACSAGPK